MYLLCICLYLANKVLLLLLLLLLKNKQLALATLATRNYASIEADKPRPGNGRGLSFHGAATVAVSHQIVLWPITSSPAHCFDWQSSRCRNSLRPIILMYRSMHFAVHKECRLRLTRNRFVKKIVQMMHAVVKIDARRLVP